MKDSGAIETFNLSRYTPFQMAVVSSRLFQRIMAGANMQLAEWRIMMALPMHQPCSSNDLCILTAMDPARVSRAQRRLEELELIEVEQDRADRRRLVVQLSDKGHEEVDRLHYVAREAEDHLFDGMHPANQDALREALSHLFDRF